MEPGDIIEFNNECYVVLRNEDNMLYTMAYDFTFDWISEDECIKVGTSDALYKVMYDIKSSEIERRK